MLQPCTSPLRVYLTSCTNVLYDKTYHKFKEAEFGFQINEVKVKGNAIPLQAWTGPEGSRRLRLPDFKTIST